MQVDLADHWFIGEVEIPSRLVLAPMAGVSVQAFRRQGRRYGAGLVCSEMVSVAGIAHRNERTMDYLRVASDEHPLAIQIFGSDPASMGEAARMVAAAGADIVDINFGCPVKKVTKTGAGASLLDDVDHAARIVSAVAGATDLPVSVKMRRGTADGSRVGLGRRPTTRRSGRGVADVAPSLGEADVHRIRRPLADGRARLARRRAGDRLGRRHLACKSAGRAGDDRRGRRDGRAGRRRETRGCCARSWATRRSLPARRSSPSCCSSSAKPCENSVSIARRAS